MNDSGYNWHNRFNTLNKKSGHDTLSGILINVKWKLFWVTKSLQFIERFPVHRVFITLFLSLGPETGTWNPRLDENWCYNIMKSKVHPVDLTTIIYLQVFSTIRWYVRNFSFLRHPPHSPWSSFGKLHGLWMDGRPDTL